MSSLPDLEAATGQAETRDLYREMVDLERRSTFAFQGSRWLSDIAPLLLGTPLCDSLAIAKEKTCPLILARLSFAPLQHVAVVHAAAGAEIWKMPDNATDPCVAREPGR